MDRLQNNRNSFEVIIDKKPTAKSKNEDRLLLERSRLIDQDIENIKFEYKLKSDKNFKKLIIGFCVICTTSSAFILGMALFYNSNNSGHSSGDNPMSTTLPPGWF